MRAFLLFRAWQLPFPTQTPAHHLSCRTRPSRARAEMKEDFAQTLSPACSSQLTSSPVSRRRWNLFLLDAGNASRVATSTWVLSVPPHGCPQSGPIHLSVLTHKPDPQPHVFRWHCWFQVAPPTLFLGSPVRVQTEQESERNGVSAGREGPGVSPPTLAALLPWRPLTPVQVTHSVALGWSQH